ncbi:MULTISPECIES: response regulator transcription factor [unclassified Ekhidna]|jgi:DNA-binding NarL/FixJ family response regulator|uniref:response regulator transcription factor n=1 Tax=unclassified Ekhidna TaxID=2632188 RepID=UPI0032DE4A1F
MRTLLLVDDHQIIRDGIRFYFEGDEEFTIKDEAENGLEALELLKDNKYDIILTDINMPKMDGLEFMKSLKENYPDQKVLVLSMYNEAGYINKMIALGANGYVLKKSDKGELVSAIKKVLDGQDHYSDEVYKTIIGNIAGRKPKERLTLEAELSDREKEVLVLIANEYTNQEIADKLFISIRTVETHKRNLLEKTGCKNVAGLVMYAVERNLV